MDIAVRPGRVLRRIDSLSVPHVGRHILACILFRWQHFSIFHTAVCDFTGFVHSDCPTLDEQSGHYVPWQPQQRAQISKASDVYARRRRS